jgi:choline dehydrogenase
MVDVAGERDLNVHAVTRLLEIQHDLLFKQNISAAEVVTTITPNTLTSNYWFLHPFSRGSVHLGSADEINNPIMDPRLFIADFDVYATMAAGKFAHRFWFTAPMAGKVNEPLAPGADFLPNNATDFQWEAYLRGFFSEFLLKPAQYCPLPCSAQQKSKTAPVI